MIPMSHRIYHTPASGEMQARESATIWIERSTLLEGKSLAGLSQDDDASISWMG